MRAASVDGGIGMDGGGVLDCGTLQFDDNQTVLEQAQRCVLDARARNQPFQLVQWQKADRSVAVAYAASTTNKRVFMLSYRVDHVWTYESVAPVVSVDEATCRSLEAQTACTVSSQSLCLECKDQVEGSVACNSSQDPTSTDCSSVGHYENGKGHGSPQCCFGLHTMSQLSAGYTGDDSQQKVCTPGPLAVFACIEGTCGDGRCEAPEAVPCGCPLDCPSAAWGSADAGVTGL